jgi:glycerophosphoryl diester phosphodiesterase
MNPGGIRADAAAAVRMASVTLRRRCSRSSRSTTTLVTMTLSGAQILQPTRDPVDRLQRPQTRAMLQVSAGFSYAGTPSRPGSARGPFFLVDDMRRRPAEAAAAGLRATGPRYTPRDFSIGHRGAALQFPEHTKESYEAAARMGAGIVECDVTFTKDKELVCRHAQNDLHTTTNILATPLAAKCIRPFTPAVFDANGNGCSRRPGRVPHQRHHAGRVQDAARQDGRVQPARAHVAEYLGGTANWRTDLYSGPTSGTLLTHKESIELFKRWA